VLLRAIGAQTATVLVYETTGELAWLWVRYQPESTLSKWFRERLAGAKGRMKKILIVAMARKLLIGLWRYATHGVIPEGAVLKPA
jgi:transposase